MRQYANTLDGGMIVHGEFTSADASTLTEATSRIILYCEQGRLVKASQLLGIEDQVVITDLLVLIGTTALTVTVFDGDDVVPAAGERIFLATLVASGGASLNLVTPHFCRVGSYPKVITSAAGQVDVQIRGLIIRRPQNVSPGVGS